jgi:hypothetical protein
MMPLIEPGVFLAEAAYQRVAPIILDTRHTSSLTELKQ